MLVQNQKRQGRALVIALACACVLLGSLFVIQSAHALLIDRELDTLKSEFAQGTLLRTSLITQPDSENDEDGAIELAQIGSLGLFTRGFTLPIPLVDHAAVAIGNRIYLVGGQTAQVGNDDLSPVANVWSGEVVITPPPGEVAPTGISLVGDSWRDELALPPVVGSNQGGPFADPVTATHSLAVAAFDNPDPAANDYLYVLGGIREEQGFSYSMHSTRIGVINPTTGAIERWIVSEDPTEPGGPDDLTLLRVPGQLNRFGTPTAQQLGVASAHTTVITESGTPYLYLIGGRERQQSQVGTGNVNRGSKRAYVARIGADGLLYQPDSSEDIPDNLGWTQVDDVPTVPDNNEAGVWNGTLLSSRSFTDQRALYLLGGQVELAEDSENGLPTYSGDVATAIIGPDGALQWEAVENAALPESRHSHSSVEFRGNMYVMGGFGDGSDLPGNSGLATYAEDDLALHFFTPDEAPDGIGSNFLVPKEGTTPLPERRAGHASVVLPGDDETAFIYVLGGTDEQADNQVSGATDETFVLGITSDNLENPVLLSTGSYRSVVETIGLRDPQIRGISWNASTPRTDGVARDIQMQYRTANAANCAAPGWTEDDWIILDGATPDTTSNDAAFFSLDGENTIEITDTRTVRCFQYRAFFSTTSGIAASPRLEDVSIRIFSPGSPDLRVNSLAWNTESSSLAVQLINQQEGDEETVNADAADILPNGSFFADLFIIGPGFNSAVLTPTLPLTRTFYMTNSQVMSSTAYAVIRKDRLDAGQTTDISLTEWRSITSTEPLDLPSLFTEDGTYTFCIAVDSLVGENDLEQFPNGFVDETNGELNNFSCTTGVVSVDTTPELPTVALDLRGAAVITEASTLNSSIIRVERTGGNVSENVAVLFTLTGDAVLGEDFELVVNNGTTDLPVTNSVVVPDGGGVDIIVRALDNTAYQEEARTLTLTLDSSEEAYILGSDAISTTLRIADDDNDAPTPKLLLPVIRNS